MELMKMRLWKGRGRAKWLKGFELGSSGEMGFVAVSVQICF